MELIYETIVGLSESVIWNCVQRPLTDIAPWRHFRDNEVFLQIENDVIYISLCTVPNDGFWKDNYGFPLVFNNNFTSIMHRFRDNDVFLQTGNDVMVISPIGGAVRSFRWRIPKKWPQVYIHALLTYFPYLQPLKSYSTFSFWLGIPYCGQNLWVFRVKWPPESQNFEKHLLRGHFLTSNRVFWAIVRGNRFMDMSCTRG